MRKCSISQTFLDQFDVPDEYTKRVNCQIDNGGEQLIPASTSIVLPIKLPSHTVSTEFLVLPRLAAPVDALLSWSWGIKMKLVLDFDKNDLHLREAPPPSACVPDDFRLLRLKPQVPVPASAPGFQPLS